MPFSVPDPLPDAPRSLAHARPHALRPHPRRACAALPRRSQRHDRLELRVLRRLPRARRSRAEESAQVDQDEDWRGQDLQMDALQDVLAFDRRACYLWMSLSLLYMLIYCAVQVRKYDRDSHLKDGVEKRVGFVFALVVLVGLLPASFMQAGSVIYVSSGDSDRHADLQAHPTLEDEAVQSARLENQQSPRPAVHQGRRASRP